MIERAWQFDDAQSITINGRTYNVQAAIFAARDLPVQEMPLSQAYIAFCCPSNDTFRSFLEHAKMVYEADTPYPILYNEDGALIDGKHRLGKLLINGAATVKFRRFEKDPPSIYK
jgi:hypothetical protein